MDMDKLENPQAMEEAFAKYLQDLETSDPEEYKALVEEMQEEMKKRAKVSTKTETNVSPETEFSPVMPGGKRVMGATGVEERKEGVKVVPSPGFVVKTRDSADNKIFVNICCSDLLGEPRMKKQLGEDGKEQEGMNVPLSLGTARKMQDKSGGECEVFDIIVHPKVLADAKEDKTGENRAFLCRLALGYVEQKHKKKVNYQYKLPKMRYKGDITSPDAVQWIRKSHKALVEEVPEPVGGAAKKTKKKLKKPRVLKQHLAYTLFEEDEQGQRTKIDAIFRDPLAEVSKKGAALNHLKNARNLVLRASLDQVESSWSVAKIMQDVQIKVAPEFVSLKVLNLYHALDLFLPFVVLPQKVSANLELKTKELVVKMPLDLDGASDAYSYLTGQAPDLGSRAWLLANALSGDGRSNLPQKSTEKEKEKEEEDLDPEGRVSDDDLLPEDRFHRNDVMSQHIKDERDFQRRQKAEQNEKKDADKKFLEAQEAEAKVAQEKAALLQQMEKQVLEEHNLEDQDLEQHVDLF